ncbi:hypothetical protein [uncultured Desulfobacter sp.]|uniref:LVIVD repeat-containing protein n=1 Tax=uncultured Desulfobacter sp. TaxID=240139 RepID=UPI002AABCD50|nr:hypothetical protein [uncultured Desulfobacter sp.]
MGDEKTVKFRPQGRSDAFKGIIHRHTHGEKRAKPQGTVFRVRVQDNKLFLAFCSIRWEDKNVTKVTAPHYLALLFLCGVFKMDNRHRINFKVFFLTIVLMAFSTICFGIEINNNTTATTLQLLNDLEENSCVRFDTGPTYLYANGRLWPIKDPETYSLLGFNQGDCTTPDWSLTTTFSGTVSQELVAGGGGTIPYEGMVVDVKETVGPHSCNNIIQYQDSGRVFYFDGKKFRWISNPEIYFEMGYRQDWTDVVPITQDLFDRYGEGDIIEDAYDAIHINLPDNTCIQFDTGPIFLYTKRRLLPIQDPETYILLGFNNGDCNTPDWALTKRFQSNIPSDASLDKVIPFKGMVADIHRTVGPNSCGAESDWQDDGKVYYFDGDNFRWIRSPEVYFQMGYQRDWSDLVPITQSLFDRYGEGAEIDDTKDIAEMMEGRAILGPLANANVRIFEYDNLTNPIYTTTTSDDTIFFKAGYFEIPRSKIKNEKLYIIEVAGGIDLDTDYDNVPDDTPTMNMGAIHLIAEGRHLKRGDFKINILTEIAYQEAVYVLRAEYPEQKIISSLNKSAGALIKEDLDGDGERSGADLMFWDPVIGKDQLIQDWSYLKTLGQEIYRNDSQVLFQKLAAIEWVNLSLIDTPGTAMDIAVSGNYAYVADGAAGMQVIDLSDPLYPEIVANYRGGESIHIIAVQNEFAYVPGDLELQIIDISAPLQPIRVSSVPITGYINCIFLSDEYAYVTNSYGMHIIDIKDPLNPKSVKYIPTEGRAMEVLVSGNYAYVRDERHLLYVGESITPLKIFDISDPTNPVLASESDVYMGCDMALSGEFAYCAIGYSGVKVVHFETPEEPIYLKNLDLPFNNIQKITISDNYAYIASGWPKLQVVDITNPENPEFVLDYELPDKAQRITIANGYAYVPCGEAGVQILNVAERRNPAIIDTIRPSFYSLSLAYHAEYIDITENFIFLTGNLFGLRLLDRSDPENWIVVEDTDYVLGHTDRVKIYHDNAYLVGLYSDIQVIDISNPSKAVLVKPIEVPWNWNTKDIDISSGFAYVGNTQGLGVMDISDPADPLLIADVGPKSPFVQHVRVSGDYAYTASLRSVWVVDVHDPASPNFLAEVHMPARIMGIALSGEYVYVANEKAGIQIVSARDPLNPFIAAIAATIETPGEAFAVAVSNSLAYVASCEGGLQIYDVTDPTAPFLTKSIDGIGSIIGVNVSDGYVYAATERGQLLILKEIVIPGI